MATFQHPASLNAFQQFGQACTILRNTTRASNPAWYQEALELNFQLHLRTDGVGITTFYHDRKKGQWSSGPPLHDEILQDPTRLDAFIAEALRQTRENGATSLGVILHVADEFSTTELKPELNNPAALPELRSIAISDPGSILEDSSLLADQASWRVLPYHAAGSEVIGTTITLSKHYTSLISTLRLTGENENFPIITHALSAPLVAIMALSESLVPTAGKPFVAILQYPWFTTLAFFNEHADLRLIRTLQHRGLRRPTNFRLALTTTNASLEFVDPDLLLIPLGRDVDTTLDADLRITFTSSRVEVIQQTQIEGIPSWCPEPAICLQPTATNSAVTPSHSFAILREEKWTLQDFLPTPQEILEIYPSRSEIRLLKILRLARLPIFASVLLCLVYFSFGIFDLTRRPEWAFDPTQVEATKGRLAKLTLEQQRAEHWRNLLDDRSKAWTNLESLARIFPENSNMLVKSYTHAAKPDSTPGKATVGFVKEWRITGFARDEALEYLNTLNTKKNITAHFSEIARITGNSAYNPSIGNRNLIINIHTQENNGFKPLPAEEINDADESTYPFTFDLTITQRFEATDPLAIHVTKAP